MELILERFCYSDEGTFGYLHMPDGMTLCTVERPWVDNMQGISCIPVDTYVCKPRRYHRGNYDAYEVLDVPGRTHILIHKANYVHQVRGCIALNSDFSSFQGMWCGVSSKVAFDHFMDAMNGETFQLKITNRIGGYLRDAA